MNDSLQILEHPGGRTMTTIGPTFPAHIAVSQAQVRLVADQTANADASTIKLNEQSLQMVPCSRLHSILPSRTRRSSRARILRSSRAQISRETAVQDSH